MRVAHAWSSERRSGIVIAGRHLAILIPDLIPDPDPRSPIPDPVCYSPANSTSAGPRYPDWLSLERLFYSHLPPGRRGERCGRVPVVAFPDVPLHRGPGVCAGRRDPRHGRRHHQGVAAGRDRHGHMSIPAASLRRERRARRVPAARPRSGRYKVKAELSGFSTVVDRGLRAAGRPEPRRCRSRCRWRRSLKH